MNKKKKVKVLFVFGTRPEAIKVVPVLLEMKKYNSKFIPIVCVTGQHREMLDQVMKPFNIIADYDLNIMINKQTLFDIHCNALRKLKDNLEKAKPDIILVQGDASSAFIGALAAFYLKIPVGHIEAGLRTNKKYFPYPEEVNRRLIGVLADLHFAPTEKARNNLLREGVDSSKIFVTGNTSIDSLLMTLNLIKKKDENIKHFSSDLLVRQNSKLILVTSHRRENFGKPLQNICTALLRLAKHNKDITIVFPAHLNPNVQVTINKILGNPSEHKRIVIIQPLNYYEFVDLMSKAYLILTDSGGIQEEAPTLDVPVLVLRDETEREEGIEAGTAKLIGTKAKTIIEETQKLLDDQAEYQRMSNVKNPYGDGKSSKRILKILLNNFQSY